MAEPHLTFDEIDSMDYDQATAAARDLGDTLARIRTQLASAKADLAVGAPRDSDWYHRTEGARSIIGRLYNRALQRAKECKRSHYSAVGEPKLRLFISVAKRRLRPETYNALWDEVEAEARAPLATQAVE